MPPIRAERRVVVLRANSNPLAGPRGTLEEKSKVTVAGMSGLQVKTVSLVTAGAQGEPVTPFRFVANNWRTSRVRRLWLPATHPSFSRAAFKNCSIIRLLSASCPKSCLKIHL